MHQVPSKDDPRLPRYCSYNSVNRPRQSPSFDCDGPALLRQADQLDGSIYWNNFTGRKVFEEKVPIRSSRISSHHQFLAQVAMY